MTKAEKAKSAQSLKQRRSATQAMNGYKQTKLGWIPEEWEVKKLKHLANLQGGFAFKSSLFRDKGEFQVLKMSNLYSGILDLNRSTSFLPTIHELEKQFLINDNDILLTLTRTFGKRDYDHTVFINSVKRNVL